MRKIYTLLVLLTALAINAQDHPNLRPELLLNKEVRVKPIHEYHVKAGRGYENFSSDEKGHNVYAELTALYSKPQALAGRTFKVTSVKPNEKFEHHYVVTLQDEKETIYFDYRKGREYYFEVIGGLTLPEDFYCDYIKEDYKTNDKARYSAVDNYYSVQIEKGIDYRDKVTTYDFYLFTTSNSTVDKGFGATVYLEGGQKIDWPKALVTRDHRNKYFIHKILSKAEVELLKKHKIVSFKLIDEKLDVPNDKAEVLRGVLNCMITKQ